MAKLSDDEKNLLLAEYPPLRDEINRTIDRMTANEVICGTFVFAVIGLLISVQINHKILELLVTIVGTTLVLVVSIFGEYRSTIFRSHLDQVESYLENMERAFSNDWGWSNHYIKNVRPKHLRQTGSRFVFWRTLQFVAFINFVQIFALFF